MALLRAKVDQDQASGTVSWLQAVNAFGFRAVQTPTVKESNAVWARVCFAGFCVKKVNGATQAALPGAEFTLTDAAGTIVGTAVSDADGRLQFRELTEGAYVLPKTGGRGTAAFYVPGAFLLLSAAACRSLQKRGALRLCRSCCRFFRLSGLCAALIFPQNACAFGCRRKYGIIHFPCCHTACCSCFYFRRSCPADKRCLSTVDL